MLAAPRICHNAYSRIPPGACPPANLKAASIERSGRLFVCRLRLPAMAQGKRIAATLPGFVIGIARAEGRRMIGDQYREWCETELENCRRALESFTEQTVRFHQGKVETTPTLVDHIRRQISELERLLPDT
jgi:hypothetical protein